MGLLQNIVIFLTIASVALTVADDPGFPENIAEQDLLKFLLRSANVIERNQKRSTSCFEYYIPLINELTLEYQKNNTLCSTDAEKARNDTEIAAVVKQEELAKKSDSACGAVTKCQAGASATTIFRCYIDEGTMGSKALQGVSNDGTVHLAELNETLRRIDSKEKGCITDNRIQYEQESADLYAQLNDCIYGVSKVPTKTLSPS